MNKVTILMRILLIAVLAAWLTPAAAAQKINLPTQARGVLPEPNGGTGVANIGIACAGTNDSVALNAAIAQAPGSISIRRGVTCAADSTVIFPSTVTLRIENGGLLKVATGQTAILAGPLEIGNYKAFTNIGAGQGNLSFVGNRTLTKMSPVWFGLDCSGTVDNSPIWNRLLSFVGEDVTMVVPMNCTDMHASTVTVSSRAGFKLMSEDRVGNGGGGQRPQEYWIGSTGGMWDFQANQDATVEGFLFTNLGTAHLDYFLRFDGNPAARIGTEEMVRYNTFTNNMANPGTFDAISVNTVSGQNHEKNNISDNDFVCSQARAFRESDSGQITSGSPNLTCGLGNCTYTTDAAIGDRIRISYATGILDTTILSITDNNHLVMNANAASTQTSARTTFREAFGNGITIGSTNAKHNTLERNSFTQCARGLNVVNGSFSAEHFGGSANDVLVYLNNISESSELAYMEDENSVREVYTGNLDAPLILSHMRNSTQAAESDGFAFFSSGARVTVTGSIVQDTPITNAVLFRAASPSTVTFTSLANSWAPGTMTMANLGFTTWRTAAEASSVSGAVLLSCGDYGITDAPGRCFQFGEGGATSVEGNLLIGSAHGSNTPSFVEHSVEPNVQTNVFVNTAGGYKVNWNLFNLSSSMTAGAFDVGWKQAIRGGNSFGYRFTFPTVGTTQQTFARGLWCAAPGSTSFILNASCLYMEDTASLGITNAYVIYNAGATNILHTAGLIESTLATGAAPFSIASTTVVPNLNVSQLLGGTWAVPGAIGSTTPSTGVFSGLTLTNIATGTQCLHANSSGVVSGTGSDCGSGGGGGAWGSITGTLTSQTDLNTALGLKAPLASPTFTGTPAAPTAAFGTSTTQLATTAFVQASTSATYYVDNCVVIGSDSNNGTSPATPWLTVAKVNGLTFNPGDSVLFERSCTWREGLQPPSSGSLGKPITFGAYGPTGAPKPIISGSDVMSGFTLNTGTVYQKTGVTTQVWAVSYNGLLLKYDHSGTSITNNEWDWNANVLYINVGGSPTGTVEAGQRGYPVAINNKSYVVLDNLALVGANTSGMDFDTTATNNTLQNCDIHNGLTGVSFATDTGAKNTVQDCKIHDSVEYGILTVSPNANYTTFQRNEIYNVGNKGGRSSNMQGIYFSVGYGSTVTHNYIHDGGDDQYADHGMYISVTDCTTATCTVSYNTITSWSAGGIKHSNSKHIDTYGNIISNHGSSGCMVVEVGSPAFINMYNNICANSNSPPKTSFGLWVSAGDRITFKNNIIYNVNYSSPDLSHYNYYIQNSPTNLVIDYNDVFDPTPGTNYADLNTVAKTWAQWQAAGFDTHGLNLDPLFNNAVAGDFRPTAASPTINAGADLGYPYNIGLAPYSFWPYRFLDQNSYGTSWNMGAFVYDPNNSVPANTFSGLGMKVNGGNGGYWQTRSLTELVTLATGATTTDTVQNLLPANSIIRAVTGRVTTTITSACTGWKLGDATTAGRFTANDTTLTANETKVGLLQADQTGAGGPIQAAAAKVRITCAGGNPGAGVIRVTSFFDQFVAPTQ